MDDANGRIACPRVKAPNKMCTQSILASRYQKIPNGWCISVDSITGRGKNLERDKMLIYQLKITIMCDTRKKSGVETKIEKRRKKFFDFEFWGDHLRKFWIRLCSLGAIMKCQLVFQT